jgi:hypothetical protein
LALATAVPGAKWKEQQMREWRKIRFVGIREKPFDNDHQRRKTKAKYQALTAKHS